MFPRQKRLKREDFQAVLTAGKRISSQNFKAVVSNTKSGYAVVVSKKTARLSVTRHRINRQALSALRFISSLPQSLILFPQTSVAKMKYQNIKEELATLLSKIH